MPDVRLRRVAEADLEIIRHLRNASRDAFFDSREITAEAQRRWFANLRAAPVDFFVIEDGGRVVGTISVTTTGAGKEIGNLLLESECRGRGLMRRAVTQVTAAPARYFARVKSGNAPSERVFRANGFSERVSASETLFEKIVV